MNWKQFEDKTAGDKQTFTNEEVRAIIRKTQEYCTDNWCNQRR